MLDKTKFSYRPPEFYNLWRRIFVFFVTHILYYIRFKLIYRLEIRGKENIPKTNDFIVAANHLSTLDPPLVATALPYAVAYMSKIELFNNIFMRWWLDWLGAFAVDREKLAVSTIKTVKGLRSTSWVLGICPQGTRQAPGKITNISKGFAAIAKTTKSNILPFGIIGTNEVHHIPFTGKIIVNIGEVIPYSDDVDDMVEKWGKSISELTGFEYIPSEEIKG